MCTLGFVGDLQVLLLTVPVSYPVKAMFTKVRGFNLPFICLQVLCIGTPLACKIENLQIYTCTLVEG